MFARRGMTGVVCLFPYSMSGIPLYGEGMVVHWDSCVMWRRVIIAGEVRIIVSEHHCTQFWVGIYWCVIVDGMCVHGPSGVVS